MPENRALHNFLDACDHLVVVVVKEERDGVTAKDEVNDALARDERTKRRRKFAQVV